MQNIIVYGAGGHAKAVIDTIEKASLYRIIGLLDGFKKPALWFMAMKCWVMKLESIIG
ncbi:FlaA1/EpsC-like NDP-sugar epimerase [Paenibacillus castaneae]|uniref:PglD-related sugar-binding protein n=1 Tax=Paenibacillus castaneae TaxID=474957 RepID=UPI00141B92F7|nr:hypothetical protein [Paenibacillus castaneae]NIK76099.1 FlaA1/EpsC-like NDP-sugar epimerase [Paenibacillus castaneae]